jgi:hypothetical protein
MEQPMGLISFKDVPTGARFQFVDGDEWDERDGTHAVMPALFIRTNTALGYQRVTPHGDPIPVDPSDHDLIELAPNVQVHICL